jgi:hypothetical protein
LNIELLFLLLLVVANGLLAGSEMAIISSRRSRLEAAADEVDWGAWEWSQGSRCWLEGMSAEGLASFKAASYAKLRAMKDPNGIPIRCGALLAIAGGRET